VSSENYPKFVSSLRATLLAEQWGDPRDRELAHYLGGTTYAGVVDIVNNSDELAMLLSAGAAARPAEAVEIENLSGIALREALERLHKEGRLPLVAKKGHSAEGFLRCLLTEDRLRTVYQRIAMVLAWAQKQDDLRDNIYDPARPESPPPAEAA
jgi:hypothetical protein